MSSIYAGSRLLEPLAEILGLRIDQLNFVVCQLAALCLGYAYRTHLHPSKVSTGIRHLIAMLVGIILGYFCFGSQMMHMFIQSVVCYGIMRLSPPDMMHKLMFVFSILYLSAMHIQRQLYDYGGYTLDITGPLMISTQKITSLAFGLHDGHATDTAKFTEEQKRRAIRSTPSALEYFSYMFYFHGVIIGPFCFFDDYVIFVEGTQFKRLLKEEEIKNFKEPSPAQAVIVKLIIAMVNLTIWFTLAQWYPKARNADSEFIASHGFCYRIVFLMFSVLFAKAKYYFAWTLGEATSNSAGIGFSGFDNSGEAKWDLLKNVDILQLEMATSFRTLISSWNIQTTNWLGYVVYTRARFQRTFLTYGLSAIWHGFYPGYYLTFIGGALFTVAARSVRRAIRHLFIKSDFVHRCYDVATWALAQLALAYVIVPFTLLELVPSLNYFNNFYWFLHIAAILALFLPAPRQKRESPKHQANGPKTNGEIRDGKELTEIAESSKKVD